MPSLVAQAIGKSKPSGQQKTAKPEAAPPASATKKSLQALAMEKATKKTATSPALALRQVDAYTSPQETRVLPTRREEVVSTPRTRTDAPASRERTPRVASEQRPAEPVIQTISRSSREIDEQESNEPVIQTVSRSARKEKSRRSRARTASNGEDDESIITSPRASGKFQVGSIVFRLIVALICAATLYFGQSFFQPPLELPTTYRQLQLGQGSSGPSMRNLLKESSGDIEDIEKFRNGLIDALKDKYSEDVSVEQLWETYVQLKRSNSLMAAALGAAVGFAFATALA